eukprot:gene2529-3419_t
MVVPASHHAHLRRAFARQFRRSDETGQSMSNSVDSFSCRSTLTVNGKDFRIDGGPALVDFQGNVNAN